MTILLFFLVVVVALQRMLELRLAEKNRALALQRGAKEFGANHYFVFVILHTAWILGWFIEGWLNIRNPVYWSNDDVGRTVLSVVSILIVIAAQALRYWAILSLGESWNTRILVVPGGKRVRNGPYRYVNHPNYLAVVLELAFVPMIVFAWKTALIASIANAVILLVIRIPTENKALQEFLIDQTKEQ